jgi:ketosteroid isomerase-like protein
MTSLFESPLAIVLVGLIIVAILGGGWVQTGRKPLLYAAVAAGTLAGLLLLAERLVVTDREAIRATLYKIAKEVENNDMDAVLTHVDSQADDVRRQAEQEFPKHHFDEVKITRIHEIAVNSKRKPPTAVVELNVVVVGTFENGALPNQQFPRFVIVTFREEDGQWRVSEYQHFEAQQGFMTREQE